MSTMIRKERWVINIPDHIYKSLLPVMKFVGQFRYLTGRDPTVHDIAKRFDRPVAFFKKLLAWMEQKEISLSTPVGDDGTSVLADLIEDRSTITPSEVLVNVDLKDKISQILKTLTPREEKIIKMRFGLEDGEEIKPLEENCALPVSADIAREIEGRAIRKLRHPSRLNKLQPFVRQVDRD